MSRIVPEPPSMPDSGAPAPAATLRNLLHNTFRVSEAIEGEIGPLLGALLGGGCVAVAILQPTVEEDALIAPFPEDG